MKMPQIAVIAIASCALASASFAASDYFLKIDGVEGESKSSDKEHKKGIEIQSFSFGREVAAPREASSGMATGKRMHKPIMVTKTVDKASPVLAKAMADGRVFPKVVIGSPEGSYTLENVTIASITPTSGGDRPMESISFNYERIEMKAVKEKAAKAKSAAPLDRAKAEKPQPTRAPN